MNQPEIAAGDLLLRPWRGSDADELVRAWSDPEIRRWTRYGASLPDREHVGQWVEWNDQQWQYGLRAGFAVCPAVGNGLVGSVMLRDFGRSPMPGRPADTAETGYWVAPAWRGRGAAPAALAALSAWAFRPARARRARAAPDRAAALGAQRGLVPGGREGRLRVRGHDAAVIPVRRRGLARRAPARAAVDGRPGRSRKPVGRGRAGLNPAGGLTGTSRIGAATTRPGRAPPGSGEREGDAVEDVVLGDDHARAAPRRSTIRSQHQGARRR